MTHKLYCGSRAQNGRFEPHMSPSLSFIREIPSAVECMRSGAIRVL
jgi:hypothetical protein